MIPMIPLYQYLLGAKDSGIVLHRFFLMPMKKIHFYL